ncbi:MAG: hypothetical protein KC613_10565, partial [Myxococcales bacterium]|nr:hypothetical protein [Myxococcales bacterium]
MIRARRDGIREGQQGDKLCLLDEATGQAHTLSSEAAAVWQAADGREGAALLKAVQVQHPQMSGRRLWQLVD